MAIKQFPGCSCSATDAPSVNFLYARVTALANHLSALIHPSVVFGPRRAASLPQLELVRSLTGGVAYGEQGQHPERYSAGTFSHAREHLKYYFSFNLA